MFDFFVSHSSIDKDTVVNDLVSILQNMGFSVWYDKNEIIAGDDIITTVKSGLSNSFCLILIITDNFFKSKWTFYETGIFDSQINRIIPLLYDVSEDNKNLLISMFGNKKYIDMNCLTNEETASELAKALNRTKNLKPDLKTVEDLKKIQKQLASFETVNTEIISIKLKEYLELLNTNKDYLILAAKQIVKIVAEDLLKYNGCAISDSAKSSALIKLISDYNIGSENLREYYEFVLLLDIEKNQIDYIQIINHALLNILTHYIHTRYPINLSFNGIKVVFPDEFTYKDFVDMFDIDKKVMREDLIADVETTYSWYKHNKYTHIGVRDINTGRIVGYFSVLPVTDEIYDKILCGNFQDKDFTSDSIEQYIFSNFYKIYIAGVGIDPKYQNTGAFIKLYNALIDLFLSLAKEREIYVSEILAEASTKQGEKFCKMVGMKKICSTSNDTDVYKLTTIPPEFTLKNRKGKELYQLCQKKFEEYRDYFDKS